MATLKSKAKKSKKKAIPRIDTKNESNSVYEHVLCDMCP